jgi:hypothetical protein
MIGGMKRARVWRSTHLMALFACFVLTACQDQGARKEAAADSPDLPEATSEIVTPDITISSVIEKANPGSIILIKAGVYREQVEIQKGITLEGEPGAIIDGQCRNDFGVRIAQDRDPKTGQPTAQDVSSIVVRGLTIRNVIQAAVWIYKDEDLPQRSAPHHITIDGNTISDFNCQNVNDSSEKYRAGVASFFGGSNIRITNNTIKYRSALPDDSPQQRSFSNGIWFASRTANASGGGHLIANNRIVGGYDGIGGETEEDPNGSFDQDTVIELNVIINGDDDGIQVEGGGENILVRQNDISLYGTGIALASPHSGPLTIEDNVIHHPRGGRQGNLFCFKVGRADGSGEAPLSKAQTIVKNNTCTADGVVGMDGIKQTDRTLAPLTLRHNCIQVSRYIYEITYGPIDVLQFDENTFSTTDPERFIKWGSNATLYRSLDEFREATGQEVSGRLSASCG